MDEISTSWDSEDLTTQGHPGIKKMFELFLPATKIRQLLSLQNS